MAHWRTMIEKDFLGAWDLVGPDGKTPRDYTLQIAEVKSQSLKTRETPKGKRKCTIRFHKATKQFVANTTNCETIESLYGGDTDGWIGKLVTLYQTDTRNPKGGGQIKCIRVRPKRPNGQAEEIKDRPVDPDMRQAQNEAYGRNDEAGREPGED